MPSGTYLRHPGERFSPQQERLGRLLKEDLQDKEIAQIMGISPHTVHTYLRALMAMIGVHTRHEVAQFFRADGCPQEEDSLP